VRRYEVAVIGAGLAGLWCARELSRRGVQVVLIDAGASVEGFVRTTGIFVRRTFDDFAFPAGCLGAPIRRVVLHSPRGRRLVLESERDEFRVGDMRALQRALLAECIGGGVDWRPRTRYCGLRAVGADVVLTLQTDAAPRDRVIARFVVGADGARSKVAAGLGLSRNRDFLIGIEDVYEGLSPTRDPALHCVLDPSLAPGYLAWVVRDSTSAHVGVGGDAYRIRPAASLHRFTRSHGFLLEGEARRTERRGGLIPVNGVLPRIACERGVLVGDAAGAVSPLTAGGLDACVRLSAFAARLMSDALRQRTCGPLTAYDGSAFAPRFIVRRWMRAALRTAGADALELVCRSLELPGLRALGASLFFGRGSFPDPTRSAARPARIAQRPAG
jgi:flavin-dependent dehydrogenase